MEKMSDRYKKWDRWIEIIKTEITDLAIHQNIFWEVQNIIKNNPKLDKPSSFYQFMGSTFAAYALMSIRRQVKINKDSISFARLLQEIYDNPKDISRKRFVSLYERSIVRDLADRDFNKFTKPGLEHIDPVLVSGDLHRLRTQAKKCEAFADKTVAHIDLAKPKQIPVFKDLNDTIGVLCVLLKRYWLLFRAEGLVSVLPTYQYDWKAIFREPWIVRQSKE